MTVRDFAAYCEQYGLLDNEIILNNEKTMELEDFDSYDGEVIIWCDAERENDD